MAATALFAAAAPQGEPAGAIDRPGGLLAPAGDGTLFGAHVQSPPGTTDRSVVEDLEAKLGRKLAIDHYYRPWGEVFPNGHEQWDIDNGRIPMVSWGKQRSVEVIAGQHDKEITDRAAGVRDFGQPMMIRYFWEMGGNRNLEYTGQPAEFVAAWRHIHDIFAGEGASNAVWVWCPDASDFATGAGQSYYPGDEYVDWTCADGYNYRHPAKRGTDPRSFEDTFRAFYDWAATVPKPMMVGEYGTLEDKPGDKAAWANAAREVIKTKFPKMGAVVYYNSLRDKDGLAYDWRMETSPESMAAFSEMANDPWFKPPVVITMPDTRIDAGPEGLVNSRDATFTFSSPTPAAGFECRADGGTWQACASPAAISNLNDGPHRFEARARTPDGRPEPVPAQRDWSIDATAPTVTAVTPADKSEAQPRDVAITATFSEPVNAESLGGGALRLVDEKSGQDVTVKWAYSEEKKLVTLQPDGDLAPGTTYRVVVGTGVADKVGNHLAAEQAWSFTTETVPLLGGLFGGWG